MPDRDEPFPFAAARDLLGLARVMWRASLPDSAQRRQLAAAGERLKRALELARESAPGSDGHAEAWRLAEDATNAIARVERWTPRMTLQEAACEAIVPPSTETLRRRAKIRW